MNNKPNCNLLDNWYFVGGGTDGKFPVNQRGQTSYSDPNSYTLDRWFRSPDGGTIELTSDGLKFTGNQDSNLCIAQFLDFRVTEDTVVTLSAIYRGQIILDYWGTTASPAPVIQNGWGLHTFSYIIPAGTDLSQRIYCPTIKTYGDQISFFKAVKLELGSQQTLAHQDEDGNWVLNEIPDYGEELAKCQRYLIPMDANSCWGLAESNTSAYLYLPLPVSMRTTPAFQGNLPSTLWPGGNSVTSISVFSPSAIENMITLQVGGTGFIAQNVYSLNQPIGFLSAEL